MKNRDFISSTDDQYGFGAEFLSMSDQQLVDAFNSQVGNKGMASAKMDYLHRLRQEFLQRKLDCSAFISKQAMAMKECIVIKGERIVPVSGPKME